MKLLRAITLPFRWVGSFLLLVIFIGVIAAYLDINKIDKYHN